MRRELWETLVDLLESLHVPEAAAQGFRIRSVALDLPVELQTLATENGHTLLADLPRWRWVGGFDSQQGRLRLEITEGA